MENQKYDAKKSQRVPMQVLFNDQLFDVAFNFKPLNDDLTLSYFDKEDEDEQGGMNQAEILFDRMIESAEGIEGYESVEELRDLIPAQDKRVAIREGLLGCNRQMPEKASGKLNYKNPAPRRVYRLKAYFDGREVENTITLNVPDADHYRVYQALDRNSFPVKFGDQQFTKRFACLKALYQALFHSATNYENDVVPVHHAILVIDLHLSGFRRVLLGK